MRQAEIDQGTRPGVTTDQAERIKKLEAENRELRRVNATPEERVGFFAAELDRLLC